MPADIHPLPEDIHAYVSASRTVPRWPRPSSLARPIQFVYPFTLEPHILAHGPPHRAMTASRQAGHLAYLLDREQAKEDRRRKELARVAPGWTGGNQALVPDRPSHQTPQLGSPASTAPAQVSGGGPPRSFLETEFAGMDIASAIPHPPAPPPTTSPHDP